MKSILVIFNGIKFPYYLMEYAITRAKKENASLHVLFLQGKEDPDEGYGFPSDMEQAETLTNSLDAVQDDERIIRHSVKLAEGMAATVNVSFTTEIKTDSHLSEIIKITEPFDLLLMDAAYDDETPSMFTNTRFSSKKLIENSPCPVELVSEESTKNVID